MPLSFRNLDARTRHYMREELDGDLAAGRLYLSPRLSAHGSAEWEALLREAIEGGDDASLANRLRQPGTLNDHESRRTPSGGMTSARVPTTAPETLAEGEFNRFYVRALCRRALEDGAGAVIVYRAKPVERPRPESQAMLGRRVDAQQLLDDLRTHQGVEPALGLPPGPNSGLSAHLSE